MSIWRNVYWFFTGAFIAFGFLGILSIGLPFLVVGVLMLVGGLFLWRGRGFWLMIVGAGTCEVIVISRTLLTAPPTCPPGEIIFGSGQGPYSCSGPLDSLRILDAIFGGILLLGLALGLGARLLRRGQPQG
jgi:hypothetical protein